ncbi:MAG: response regulator, partial [Armatimonadota bacterium]|nr:response regulator [Armatimonadota bacterium]
TGLGLAMVYGTVQRHEGEVEIESELGRGTTVRLVLPVFRQPVHPEAAEGAPVPEVAGPLRVLVVDDEPMLLQLLSDLLQEEGHQVVTADGGQAGIEAFQESVRGGTPFDLVVTDLGMPRVNGRKVAAAVKELSPSTPVIMLTGWGNRLDAEGGIPLEVDAVLGKPLRLREFRAALARVIGGPKPH